MNSYSLALQLGLMIMHGSSVKMKLNSIVSFNGGKVLVRAVDPKQGTLEYQGVR